MPSTLLLLISLLVMTPGAEMLVRGASLLALLIQGSRWFVGSAIEVARWIGASELLIGLTIVAAGTSLPELMTPLVASYRGETDIAVGNVIGSNSFNVFGILGICSVVQPQELGS